MDLIFQHDIHRLRHYIIYFIIIPGITSKDTKPSLNKSFTFPSKSGIEFPSSSKYVPSEIFLINKVMII